MTINEALFDYTRHPRKLNLGCGFDTRPDYLNVDLQEFHKPDLVCDVRRLPMLPSAYYDEIVASDVLEHLPRLETGPVLMEWNRLLKEGGLLNLRAPNIIGLLELFAWDDKQSVREQENLVQCLFGTQAYEGDYHFTGFTRLLIEHYLREAGFFVIELRVRDHWLFEVVAEKRSEAALYDSDRGDDGEFIREAYQMFLHRAPDEEGFSYYLSMLRNGKLSRNAIAEILRNSDEKNIGQCVSGDESPKADPCRGETDAAHLDTIPLPLFTEMPISKVPLKNLLWKYLMKYGNLIERIPLVRTVAEKCYHRMVRTEKY